MAALWHRKRRDITAGADVTSSVALGQAGPFHVGMRKRVLGSIPGTRFRAAMPQPRRAPDGACACVRRAVRSVRTAISTPASVATAPARTARSAPATNALAAACSTVAP